MNNFTPQFGKSISSSSSLIRSRVWEHIPKGKWLFHLCITRRYYNYLSTLSPRWNVLEKVWRCRDESLKVYRPSTVSILLLILSWYWTETHRQKSLIEELGEKQLLSKRWTSKRNIKFKEMSALRAQGDDVLGKRIFHRKSAPPDSRTNESRSKLWIYV